MEILQEMLQQIDWSLLFLFITFILTLSYSYYDKYSERKRKLNNVRTILFKELSDNYVWTEIIADEAKIGVDIADKNHTIVAAYMTTYTMNFLSVIIFDTYLDRLDALKPREVVAIYDAYSAIKRAIKSKNDLDNVYESAQNIKEASAGTHLYYINEMYEKTRNALILFKEGKEFVEFRDPHEETGKLLKELTTI